MIVPGAGSIGAYLMAFTLRFLSFYISCLISSECLPLSVELVGKSEQFPGIPWNATVFAIVGFVIVLLRHQRFHLRNMIAMPFALGEATNGLVAYILPQWIHFQVAILAPHL